VLRVDYLHIKMKKPDPMYWSGFSRYPESLPVEGA
jgi:hypothetical protein